MTLQIDIRLVYEPFCGHKIDQETAVRYIKEMAADRIYENDVLIMTLKSAQILNATDTPPDRRGNGKETV